MILDCDPGHDDAVALVVASRFADLVGVTTVAGNAPLAHTTRNARIVLDLVGSDVPLHSGAQRPLVAPPRHAQNVHGENGLAGAVLPEPSRPADSQDAVGFLIDMCRSTEGLWLVPIGPLTNIALALRAAPDIADRIAGISLMGGGTFGNRTPAAEFNIWADPEAAAIVFAYGGKLVMSGLDVCHQLQATPERVDSMRRIPGTLGPLYADLFAYFLPTIEKFMPDLRGAPMFDVCAVLSVTHPALFEGSDEHVVVETAGEHTAGMTLIDIRPRLGRPDPNCRVQWKIDHEASFALIVEALTAFS
ncbi:MAG: hypothetical protein RLZ48_387 [Actinomycetota bacterium]|jgi:inosine-uridine nucleoside N-ribohydrolase